MKGEKPPTKQAATFAAQHQFLSRNRSHTEGINAFFSRLHYSARNHPEISVSRLEKDHWITGIEPDGKGEITWGDSTTLPFWLEHDRGTETLAYLARKIKSYRDRADRNPDLRESVLLIELPSERRLRNFLPIGTGAWNQDVSDWDSPTLVVAVSASNLNERTFSRPEDFPDAFTDRLENPRLDRRLQSHRTPRHSTRDPKPKYRRMTPRRSTPDGRPPPTPSHDPHQ